MKNTKNESSYPEELSEETETAEVGDNTGGPSEDATEKQLNAGI